jgi:hypothetical protein
MPNLDVFHIPNTNVTTHPSGQVSNSHNLTHNINANPSAYLAVQNMNTKDSKMENIKYNR